MLIKKLNQVVALCDLYAIIWIHDNILPFHWSHCIYMWHVLCLMCLFWLVYLIRANRSCVSCTTCQKNCWPPIGGHNLGVGNRMESLGRHTEGVQWRDSSSKQRDFFEVVHAKDIVEAHNAPINTKCIGDEWWRWCVDYWGNVAVHWNYCI